MAGRRVYGPDTLRTLAVIETGQRAGLTLEEIKALLAASPDDTAAIDRLREVAERKLPEITALIERSLLVREWLECAARCECPSLDQCPLFDDPAALPRSGAREPTIRSAQKLGRSRSRSRVRREGEPRRPFPRGNRQGPRGRRQWRLPHADMSAGAEDAGLPRRGAR